jgi:alpha-amylase
MGDDLEKFGAWPGTHDHCYRDGWLEKFFSVLGANREWLGVTLPREYLAAHPPLGRADLPTASYPEMMEWVLPTQARERFHRVQQEFTVRADVQQFLRGGFWRGFFSKYAEANLLHKKMLYVAGRVRRVARPSAKGTPAAKKLAEAKTHLLRAQCNDAYWHGVFGGLYSPHLRTELWHELIRAETIADSLDRAAGVEKAEQLDFDADGAEEIYVTSKHGAALLKPADGGAIAALDFRPQAVALVNSLERRLEAYHGRLKDAGKQQEGLASIHDQTRVKEEGLEHHLKYDRWPRHAFRLLLFPPWKMASEHAALTLEESALFAAGHYAAKSVSPERVELRAEGPLIAPMPDQPADPSLRAVKTFTFGDTRAGFDVGCSIELSYAGPEPLKLLVGLEIVLNFLAPDAPDRYFESAASERHPLRWTGVMPAPKMRVVDEWRGLAVALDAPRASQFWIAPIETVSESEEGFERVYQGSQIMAVWPAEVGSKTPWKAALNLRVSTIRD